MRGFCAAVWAALIFCGFGVGSHDVRAGESSAQADFASQFARPPSPFHILKIIHGWPDAPQAQDQLIERLDQQGFGGVVCNISFDDYLVSDHKWEVFKRAVTQAKAKGFSLWLYDERGYPSGNAGGLVLTNHPEWEARGLLAVYQDTTGGKLTLNVPPGNAFLVAAFPMTNGFIDFKGRIDLSDQLTSSNRLIWDAPLGNWKVMAVTENRLYEGTHADMNLWSHIPYFNMLMAEPTARFLQVTHQGYADHLGQNLGRNFVSTFTDEPSLMSAFIKPMPYRPLPWAPNLPEVFKKRRGYALAPIVPSLIVDGDPMQSKHRYDYWQTIAELVSANYFGQIRTWCQRHNIPSGGHLLMEEGIAAHTPLYGDFFRCLRQMDAPGIDCLTSLPPEVPWMIARLAGSAAELEGNSIVMCETSDHGQRYRPAEDKRPPRTVTEAEIRGTCNRLFVGGVNAITSYYSFADLSDDALRRLNEWVGRCCMTLRGGRQAADVAVLYPAESLWVHFTPARLWANESAGAARIENTLRAAADSLFESRREFTFVDSRTLSEAQVKSGALTQGPLRWRVLILPATDTLPLAAWENIRRFARSGGVVIALGDLPKNSQFDFPSLRVQAIAKELFGEGNAEPRVIAQPNNGAGVYLPEGSEGLLPLSLTGLLEPEVKVSGAKSPIRTTHRRIDGKEVYFVANDSPSAWHGDVSFAADGKGEQWNPASGEMTRTVAADVSDLSLEPYGAAVFRFPTARQLKRYPGRTGSLPNLELIPLPNTTPTAGPGEFVKAELLPDVASSIAGLPAWSASATLTKSKVDCWLFTCFRYPQSLELENADCIVVDTWVPEGQNTPNQLLVFLVEKGGGDFLANTGRFLSTPGYQRVYVPISRFQRFGASKAGDGGLDMRRVNEVRVGWGGYLGENGEKIRFSVALPQMGRCEVSGAKP